MRELNERLEHLDRTRRARPPLVSLRVDDGARLDADVVIAGGGLWTLLAPVLAERGLDVLVVERARAGVAHREWNASARELEALVHAGIVTSKELDRLILARYDHGVCRFHGGGGPYPVRGVLDCSVDADALLTHARSLAERRGVRFLDGATVDAEGSSATRAVVRANGAEIVARLVVDARGASSPHATADLVCPTVGGVFEAPGVDPTVGDILATIDPIDPSSGRQHIWEGFPGRPGEVTIYLFYYAHAVEPMSLAALYDRFDASLARYQPKAGRMLRPTFGFIPGWSRLVPPPTAGGRIVLVGDAAARHSPLTYCGFGATLRSLVPAADAIEAAVRRRGPAPRCIVDDQSIHRMTGALADLLCARTFRGQTLNELLDAAFATLHGMNEGYARLLRDEMGPREVTTFLRQMAARHPAVWRRVVAGLGPARAARWMLAIARSLVPSSMYAA